jgi:hypothetical protein
MEAFAHSWQQLFRRGGCPEQAHGGPDFAISTEETGLKRIFLGNKIVWILGPNLSHGPYP